MHVIDSLLALGRRTSEMHLHIERNAWPIRHVPNRSVRQVRAEHHQITPCLRNLDDLVI